MEKIKAKVEQVLHKGDHSASTHTGTHTGTTGVHTGTTSTGQTTGLTGTHNTHSDPTGPHDSRLANKLDPRVDSDQIGGHGNTASAGGPGRSTHTGTHTGAHTGGLTGNTYGSDPTGPHDSHLTNKLDPRVDSDRIGGHGNTVSTGGPGHSTHTGTHTGGLTGNAYGSDPTGPHDSHLANKLDPRVDSDRAGGYGNTTGASGYGSTHTGGLTGNTHTGHSGLAGNTYGSDPTGPHDSRLANKVDPRVDSDRIGGHGNIASAGGLGHSTHTGAHAGGLTGNTYGSDPTGPHESRLANKLDPRVDSDQIGSRGNAASAGGLSHTTHAGTHTGAHSGGLTGNTYGSDPTGPHDSHLANKLDPRVDSDRIGGHGNTTSTGGPVQY